MKILFVYFGLPIGGIELFIVKIVKRLKKKYSCKGFILF